jgi:restriction system protein
VSRKRADTYIDRFLDLLKTAPVWVGPVVAVALFVAFRFVLPLCIPPPQRGADPGRLWRTVFMLLSWLLPVAVLLAWGMAEFWKLMNRRLLDGQTGLGSIRDVSWREFERLVCEAYRRQGYLADVVGSESGDGGVDVRLTRNSERVLVQCKQWRAYTVGVTTLRELLGVVVSERATKGIVVTSGRFTAEAQAFARQSPQIELVDGPALAELVRNVQTADGHATVHAPATIRRARGPSCPLCHTEMVFRTARKGQNAGSRFWGCPKYPACRGTRPWP